MRNPRLLLLWALSLVALLAGCGKEENRDAGLMEEPFEMSVSLPDGPITKTFLGERAGNLFPLLWSEGDRLSLNGTFSYPLSAEAAGNRNASFAFRGSVRAPFNVLYPATAEADKVSFPTVQNYVAGSFDPPALPMYASSESYSNASMHHLGTLLGFPFTGTGTALKQLIVMSLDGAVLSGSFSLEKNEAGAFTGAFSASEGATTATLDFPEGGLALSSEPVTAWVAVPSGEYPKGFIALVVDTADQAMTLSFFTKEAADHNLAPGSAILFPATAFNPGEGVFLIDEPEDLMLLSKEPTSHLEVLMVKDIDMSGIDGWTPVEGFTGVFNGAGHTVGGLNGAVFGTLSGEVRNLVVDASIASDTPVLAGIANDVAAGAKVSACRVKGSISYTGTSGAAVYLGGVAAKNHGEILSSSVNVTLSIPAEAAAGVSFVGVIAGYVTAESAVNFSGLRSEEGSSINLVYPKSDAPQLRAGGLFGYVNAPAIYFSECFNAASFDITVPAESSTSKMWIGGIVGNALSSGDGRISFVSCENKGSFTLLGKGGIGENSAIARPSAVAGIVAKCQVGGSSEVSEILFDGCSNSGNISLTSNTGKNNVYGRITYLAGICGDAIAAKVKDNACINTGNINVEGFTDRVAMAGHIGILWRSEGTGLCFELVGKGDDPVNTGALLYKDGSSAAKHPMAGGIVGVMMAQEATPLAFTISDCTNSGMIDRSTPSNASFTTSTANEASAGGIVANIGFQTSTESYSFVTGTIENCSNAAQITFNAYAGETIAVEKTTDQTFLGGILGFSHARNGLVSVKDCSNGGYVRLTAGNAGGIVGRIQSNTTVTGCTNSARVGEFDLTLPTSYVSTGWSITGGIAGAMLFTYPEDVSKIEYCHNAGDVSGCHRKADGAGTIARPTVGGIIGRYDAGRSYAAVRYCKNSGHVRSYRAASSSSTWQYSGIISGSYPEDPVGSGNYAIVRDCGIGGFISRASWIVPTAEDGEYPYYNYIYCFLNLGEDYPITTEEGTGFAEGCLAWDGVSKLPWEE